jgi:hypothetical protein
MYLLGKECQRILKWQWKGEYFPLAKAQIQLVRDQLSNERFTVQDHSLNASKYANDKESDSATTSDSQNDEIPYNALLHEGKINPRTRNEKKNFPQPTSKG